MCAAAQICPSKNQQWLAVTGIVERRKLTSGAFGVPSYQRTLRRRPAARRNQSGVTMLDTDLKTMIDDVKDGRMDRRAFIQRLAAIGLTAPMATQILAIGGVAMAQSPAP